MKCSVCKKDITKHIIKEGARFHVPHWFGSEKPNGQVEGHCACSEKSCEINHEDKCKVLIINDHIVKLRKVNKQQNNTLLNWEVIR